MRDRAHKTRLEISIARTRFFILDSSRPSSLTLRDYSKVVSGYKQSLFNKKSKLSRSVRRSHAVESSMLVGSLPCRCRSPCLAELVVCSGHKRPRSGPRLGSERRHSGGHKSHLSE